jgi:hypothetical protein
MRRADDEDRAKLSPGHDASATVSRRRDWVEARDRLMSLRRIPLQNAAYDGCLSGAARIMVQNTLYLVFGA